MGRRDAAALRARAARRHSRRAGEGPRARRRNQLHLPLSVRLDAVLPAQSRAARGGGGDAAPRGRDDVRVERRRGTGAGDRRVLRDLRAQARVPDARRFVHPLSAAALGDLRRAGDPLLRGPQRLRSRLRRARAGGAGAAAARRDPARARSRDRRAVRRSARWAPSNSTRSSGSTNSSWRSTTARRRRENPVRDTAVVRELAQYCKQTIQC